MLGGTSARALGAGERWALVGAGQHGRAGARRHGREGAERYERLRSRQVAAIRPRGQLRHGHSCCDTVPVRAVRAAMRAPGCAAGPAGYALGALSLF